LPYHISSVKLEGIRGFNNPVSLSLEEGVTLIYGPNGSGKSSLLQAVEWCITGAMPYMKGGDFTREDAIVNLFHDNKKATVEVQLKGLEPTLTLTRSRKMTSSTSRGRQPLQLEAQGEPIREEEEAEEELQRRLKISLESFSRAKYLHQETIREALASKPEERSEAIDRLLGTYEVREFANALDLDRQISATVKRIETSIEGLNRDKIQFILNLKRGLETSRKTLLGKGFLEEELTLGYAVDKLTSLRNKLNEIREHINLQPTVYQLLQPNVSFIVEGHRKLLEDISTTDRMRMEHLQESQKRRMTIQSLSERYSEAVSRGKELQAIDVSSLRNRIATIDAELKEVGARTQALRQRLTAFPSRKSTYQDLKKRLDEEHLGLTTLLQRFGDENTVKQRIQGLGEELEACKADLEKLSGHQRLIKLAADYLEKTETTTCPVCSQDIVRTKLVEDLRSKVSVEIALNIERIQEKEKSLKLNLGEQEETLRQEQSKVRSLEELNMKLRDAIEALHTITGKALEEVDLETLPSDWEKEHLSLLDYDSKLRSERGEIEETIIKRDQILLEMANLQRQLQQETGCSAEGIDLLEKAKDILAGIDEETRKYSETAAIDESKRELMRLSDILSYLRDEENTEASERELPIVSKQIEDLEARKNSLQLLEGSLHSIRKLAMEYGREASLAQLRKLEQEINVYYSAILGHPYFHRLKVDIEKEEPLIYSIRAASDSEATYIPTRFSTSQLNIAALSIFMSNCSQLAGELPIMILDDPTQNMDPAHKEALAQLVSKLSSKYQIIVSTEDAETKDFLKKHCISLHTYEFVSWSTSGPEIKGQS